VIGKAAARLTPLETRPPRHHVAELPTASREERAFTLLISLDLFREGRQFEMIGS
jgi:hypothetical protein